MMWIASLLASAVLALGSPMSKLGKPASPAPWSLSNGQWSATVQQRGAILSSLRWNARGPNWLSRQAHPLDVTGYERYGHFLCFDRWGPVTKAEAARGIPFHGAAGLIPWSQLSADSPLAIKLQAALPVTDLEVDRSLRMATASNVLLFANRFYNPTNTTHPYNAVEHATLSQYWCGHAIRMYSNASTGFIQDAHHVVPGSQFTWPKAPIQDRIWDLSLPILPKGSTIASLTFPDQARWGWVCLKNEDTGDVLGYVWPLDDYPWLNLWWSCRNGRILQRAVEPGTTGLARPLPELKKIGSKLQRPLYAMLAPETRSRSYRLWCFALRYCRTGGTIQDVSLDLKQGLMTVTAARRTWVLPLP